MKLNSEEPYHETGMEIKPIPKLTQTTNQPQKKFKISRGKGMEIRLM